MRPEARKIGIVAQDVEDEFLVYDLERDEAHCLNQVTSLVWRHADGKSSVATIVDAVRRESPGEVDQAVVLSALRVCRTHLLIEVKHSAPDDPSRRPMIRRVALIGGLTVAGSQRSSRPAAQTGTPTPTPAPRVLQRSPSLSCRPEYLSREVVSQRDRAMSIRWTRTAAPLATVSRVARSVEGRQPRDAISGRRAQQRNQHVHGPPRHSNAVQRPVRSGDEICRGPAARASVFQRSKDVVGHPCSQQPGSRQREMTGACRVRADRTIAKRRPAHAAALDNRVNIGHSREAHTQFIGDQLSRVIEQRVLSDSAGMEAGPNGTGRARQQRYGIVENGTSDRASPSGPRSRTTCDARS